MYEQLQEMLLEAGSDSSLAKTVTQVDNVSDIFNCVFKTMSGANRRKKLILMREMVNALLDKEPSHASKRARIKS